MANRAMRRSLLGSIGLAMVLAGAAWPVGEAAPPARPRDEAPARAALPADLERVPRDAVGMVSVRVADLWKGTALAGIRRQLGKDFPTVLKEIERVAGTAPQDIERVTVVLTDIAPRAEPVVLVATTKPYDRDSVFAVVGTGSPEEYMGHDLKVSNDHRRAAHLIDDHHYLLGSAYAVREFLGWPDAGADGPLSDALRQAAGKHLLVAGVNGTAIARAANRELADPRREVPPEMRPFLPLLKTRTATVVADLGDELEARVRLTFPRDADAKSGEKALRLAADLFRDELRRGINNLSQVKEADRLVELGAQVDAAVKRATIERQGPALLARVAMKMDEAKTGVALLEAVQKVRQAAARTQSANNLKQIALAMHIYADTNAGTFPAHAIYDKSGKPLLSWRVAILPNIDQDALYRQFHLDEAWDSPHNKKLLAQMPPVYTVPGDERARKAHETHYQVFYGKGAAFEGKKGTRFPASFLDGTSNTIMVVEAAKAVPWSKPEDIPFDQAKAGPGGESIPVDTGKALMPKLGGLYPGGFNAAFCDGSVHYLRKSIKPDVLRLLIIRNDGMVLPEFE